MIISRYIHGVYTTRKKEVMQKIKIFVGKNEIEMEEEINSYLSQLQGMRVAQMACTECVTESGAWSTVYLLLEETHA